MLTVNQLKERADAACPKCSAELTAPADYKGRTVKCKACGSPDFMRVALDTLTRQLGYSLAPPDDPNPK